jgi:hypothetical protein
MARAHVARAFPLRVLSVIVAALALLTACGGDDPAVSEEAAAPTAPGENMSSPGMNEGAMAEMTADAPRVPPVYGYYGGEEVFFIHTETSDPAIASTLEGMMGSPVPVVESLARDTRGRPLVGLRVHQRRRAR